VRYRIAAALLTAKLPHVATAGIGDLGRGTCDARDRKGWQGESEWSSPLLTTALAPIPTATGLRFHQADRFGVPAHRA
jgi:hypothetical protein